MTGMMRSAMSRWSPAGRVRRRARGLLAQGLVRVGAIDVRAAVERWVGRGIRLRIIAYHRVVSEPSEAVGDPPGATAVSRPTLAAHLAELQRTSRIVDLDTAADILEGRIRAPHDDLSIITFDDGYASVVEHALPVLREAEVSATVYVSTGVVLGERVFWHDRLDVLLRRWRDAGRPWVGTAAAPLRDLVPGTSIRDALTLLLGRLDANQIEKLVHALAQRLGEPPAPGSVRALDEAGVRTLHAAGWTIGTHTHRHVVLPLLPDASVDAELARSSEWVERWTGVRPRHFAYPNGYHDDRIRAALVRHGYRTAVSTESGMHVRGQDLLRLYRRTLWEGSTQGAAPGADPALVACQVAGAWPRLEVA